MNYYLDTEFIEAPNFIDLISLGIKCEDGRTFYAESNEFDINKANSWVKENVIPQLKWYGKRTDNFIHENFQNHSFEMFTSNFEIAYYVKKFIKNDTPNFWGYYADYDWVVFCWLFGTMMDLPKGWPMYCKDLKQLMEETGKDKINDPIGEHNALTDAIWNEQLHKHLKRNH